MKLTENFNKNLSVIKDRLNSDDVAFTELNLGDKKGVLIFIKDIVDKDKIGELILRPTSEIQGDLSEEELFSTFLYPEKEKQDDIDKIIELIVSGYTLLIVDGLTSAFSFALLKFEKRAITEPPMSTVIKGPREGFVENIAVNVSLMRRKLKTEKLKFINLTVGGVSKTPVVICYIEGIADNKVVRALKKKIESIEKDALLDSSYVAKYLCEHKTSIFRQIGNTEKPDILSAKILEGRVAIFVDGSPIALTIPYLLIEEFQSPSDYYNSPYNASVSRIIRLFSVFVSIMLPAFFVSAQLFHLQLIPLSFLLTIVNSIKGIPLSPSYEMFFTLLIFEILNEASVRMPKYVGMVVSIVGGLVLGETAVNAGIISAPILMLVAFSGICLYTVPDLERTFSMLRFLLLVVGGTLGMYGVLCAVAYFTIYLVSFESYKTPLLAPFSPLIKTDLKDGLIKGFVLEKESKPYSLKNAHKKEKEN